MERIFIMILVLCVVVKAYHSKHPKFPHYPKEIQSHLKKEKCSQENEDIRNELIKQSKCGEPREVFEPLRPSSTHEIILPAAVWVKRCVGLCDYSSHSCVATSKRTRRIPVRVSDVSTGKEYCLTYEIEEHLSCGCDCKLSKEDCDGPQIFNPRKCSCQCPNVEERRICLRKRSHNMKWNRYKCTCEEKMYS